MKTVKLNRNKIYSIGKEKINTVTIKQIYKSSNKIINSWKVYKSLQRKNKIIAYTLSDHKLTLKFKTIKHAKDCQRLLKKALK